MYCFKNPSIIPELSILPGLSRVSRKAFLSMEIYDSYVEYVLKELLRRRKMETQD